MKKYEQWLHKNKAALKQVKEGIKAAKEGRFAQPPNIKKDAK